MSSFRETTLNLSIRFFYIYENLEISNIKMKEKKIKQQTSKNLIQTILL